MSALRAAGAVVQSLAAVGRGCPDLLVSRAGRMYLFECKSKGGKLEAAQVKWHADWKADVHVVYTADDALRAIGAIA